MVKRTCDLCGKVLRQAVSSVSWHDDETGNHIIVSMMPSITTTGPLLEPDVCGLCIYKRMVATMPTQKQIESMYG